MHTGQMRVIKKINETDDYFDKLRDEFPKLIE